MGSLRDSLGFVAFVRVLLFLGWAVAGLAAVPNRETNALFHLPPNPIFEGYGLRPLFPALLFDNPVAVTAPPGETNRLFIVERTGRIMVVTNLAAPTKTVFLDLAAKVYADYLEAGLLGLAFHPGYATNRSFFVFRTRVTSTTGITNALHNELTRFEASPTDRNRAFPESEQRVWAEYDASEEHNGGDMHFGPDGYLYVSLGNGPAREEWAFRRQPVDEGFFNGIIRIDVDRRPGNLPPNPHPGIAEQYLVPKDNPFIGATNHGDVPVDPSRVRTEYYAIGLRNPWRMSFDPVTGALYCGDVGGGQVEEIDVIERGGNYGWPYREATNVTDLYLQAPRGFRPAAPLYSYLHGRGTNQGGAVVGGVVYRGLAVPGLHGAYIFGDNPSGHIWALRHDGTGLCDVQRLVSEPGVAAFGTDPRNGDVLVVNHASGAIKSLTYVALGDAPLFPKTLADTGLFADLKTLSPASGLRSYSINVPFWSDAAFKSRWFSVPDGQSITFAPDASWLFPIGTIWVKHFELRLVNNTPGSARRIETRVLVKNEEGVYGVTYRWGNSLTNAVLVPEVGLNEAFLVEDGGIIRTQIWNYPARHECLSCHTPSAGYVLGFGTSQLNRTCENSGCSGNQIQALSDQGYFASPVPEVSSLRALANATNTGYPLEYRVRSYWAANCAQCHNPGGVETVVWDARITTPIKEAKVIDVIPIFNPGAIGTLDNGVVVVGPGSVENRIIKPNAPVHSVLLTRLSTQLGVRMPPLGSTVLDHGSIHLVSNWIQSLPAFPWDHHDLPGSGFEGSASIAGGVYQVAASNPGFGSERALDAGHFLHRWLWANGQITARLPGGNSNLEPVSGLAGLMVRENLTSSSPAAAVWLNNSGRATFERRRQPGENIATVSSPDSSGFSWIRLSRENSQIRALTSADGTNWVLLGEETIHFSGQARIGLAAVAPGPARFYEAVFEDVSVQEVALTNPMPGSVFVQPTTVSLNARVEAMGSSVGRVEFYAGTNWLGQVDHPPYVLEWTNPPAGLHFLIARAVDTRGSSVNSAAVHIQVDGPIPSALLIKSNATTKGVWKNQFGKDGVVIVGDSTNLPSYATVTVPGARTAVWSPATVDGRALERVRGLLRVAAGWEADREVSIDLNLVDGRLHRLALYFLDWDSTIANLRSQAVELVDAGTGEVLERQNLSGFSGGIYLVWQLRGHVQVRVTSNNARTAVVSGLFLDPDDNLAPEVRLVSPSPGEVFRLPASIPLTAEAADPDGNIARVDFLVDGISVGEAVEEPFQVKWRNMLAGRRILQARAIDDSSEPKLSEPIEVTVEPASPVAGFVGVDSTTHGQWKGRYGMDGYLIINHATNLPPYASVVATNIYDFTLFDWSSREVALEHVEDSFGIEAGWFPLNQNYAEFSVDVRLGDGTNHLVSFYVMDFDFPARIQRMDLVGTGGEILDSQEATVFSEGKYFTWTVRGPVTARFKGVRGISTLSGIFFDPDLNAPPSVSLVHPTNGTPLTSPTQMMFRAEVRDPEGDVRRVEFFADGRRVGTISQPPFEFLWKDVLAGEYPVMAKAIDGGGRTGESRATLLDVQWVDAQAGSFKVDSDTAGRWKLRYGRDGYLIVNHATNLPAYAQVIPSGAIAVTHLEPSTNHYALEHVDHWLGIEAGWMAASNELSLDIRLADGRPHVVTLYSLEWGDPQGAGRIEIVDSVSGVRLDLQELSGPSQGQYYSWLLKGRVTLRIAGLSNHRLISGLFFDPPWTLFQAWLVEHFNEIERTSSAISGPDADPDADGLDNRTEYALGLDPRLADVQSRPSLGISNGSLVFTYTRAKAASDVALFIEWSADLAHWGDAASVFETLSSVDEGTVQRIALRSRSPLSGGSLGFLRTRVVGP